MKAILKLYPSVVQDKNRCFSGRRNLFVLIFSHSIYFFQFKKKSEICAVVFYFNLENLIVETIELWRGFRQLLFCVKRRKRFQVWIIDVMKLGWMVTISNIGQKPTRLKLFTNNYRKKTSFATGLWHYDQVTSILENSYVS